MSVGYVRYALPKIAGVLIRPGIPYTFLLIVKNRRNVKPLSQCVKVIYFVHTVPLYMHYAHLHR